jgi:hypothetical protein
MQDSFENYYKNELIPLLQPIEEARKKSVYMKIGFSFLITGLIVFFYLQKLKDDKLNIKYKTIVFQKVFFRCFSKYKF